MKRSKCMNLRITIILSVLLILALAFIWGHSMFSAVDSAEESRRVGQWITPFLEQFVGPGNVTDHLVRKLAHFCEYGVLVWDMVRRRTVDDPAELGTKAANSKMVRSLDFHVTPHLLRHTYITRLFESGLDIKEIQYLAGHTTVDMTLRVYTHYQHETRQQDTANKVCAALG